MLTYAFLPMLLLYLTIRSITFEKRSYVFSIFWAVTSWAIILYVITEFLSLFSAMTFYPLAISWIIINIILLIFVILKYKKINIVKVGFPFLRKENFTAFSIFIIAASVSVFVLSILTVPYNPDSMSYHLPRIVCWAQNNSVAHYATNDARQLSSPMIAEFINLNSYVFFKTDKFFNVVQSASYIFNIFGVYAISRELKLSKKESKTAVLLFMAMPIALAEAFTTQVDNFSAVWTLIFAYECLTLFNKNKLELNRSLVFELVFAGFALGLGYLSKPSVCIPMFIFAIALIIVRITKKDAAKTVIASPLIAGFTALTVVAPEIVRNIFTFNAISDANVGSNQLVATINPLYLIVNFVKNIAFSLPTALITKSNYCIYKAVMILADILNVDIDNVAISELGRAYHVGTVDLGHDTTSNPLHTWLIIITFFILIYCIVKRKKVANAYIWCSFLSFFIFMLVLRWEPYISRYQIPFIAILCPSIVYIINKGIKDKKKTAFNIIISFLCILSFANGLSHNSIKCLFDVSKRPVGYFGGQTDCLEQHQNVIDIINQNEYKTMGLYSNIFECTYAFWAIDSSLDEIRYINITNSSDKYESSTYTPDCIVWISESIDSNIIKYNNKKYKLDYSEKEVLSLNNKNIYLFSKV